MDFRITLQTGEQLQFTPSPPSKLIKKLVFPHALYSSGKWGSILFQIFSTEGCTAHISSYVFKDKTTLHSISGEESFRLRIVYKNNFSYYGDFGKLIFKEKQFNLVYFSKVDWLSEFNEGEYTCFDFKYSKAFLQRFAPYLDRLEEFLNTTETMFFHQDNLFATQGMIKTIDDVLNHKYHNNIAKFYLESKALEILTLAFEKLNEVNSGDNFKIDRTGEERAKRVKVWIDENYDNPGTLREIAMRFGTNEFKLKKEFKAIYGTSVFDHLLKTKLLKAKKLLLETDMPIADIAYITGYAIPGHFSRAFKKEFGVTPKYMRKYK
jgi:AraC-like DNA-binding protein